jgi:hypothetical protein
VEALAPPRPYLHERRRILRPENHTTRGHGHNGLTWDYDTLHRILNTDKGSRGKPANQGSPSDEPPRAVKSNLSQCVPQQERWNPVASDRGCSLIAPSRARHGFRGRSRSSAKWMARSRIQGASFYGFRARAREVS